jgi:hypothetical protein
MLCLDIKLLNINNKYNTTTTQQKHNKIPFVGEENNTLVLCCAFVGFVIN